MDIRDEMLRKIADSDFDAVSWVDTIGEYKYDMSTLWDAGAFDHGYPPVVCCNFLWKQWLMFCLYLPIKNGPYVK